MPIALSGPARCRALTDLIAALIDPKAYEAFGRTVTGMHIGNSGSRHGAVPGFTIGNVPVNPVSGTEEPCAPINPAVSTQSPGSCTWHESLPGFALGAGNS